MSGWGDLATMGSLQIPALISMAAAILALIPALLFRRNLSLYRPPPPPAGRPAVSLLIPARDEERSIGAALAAALTSEGVDLEVIVLDDGSRDATPQIVAEAARRDSRVRLVSAPPLPMGWCGKQHACATLARLARADLLAFVDADVRLAPDGLARAAAFLRATGAGLVSGLPRQETETWLERLLIPLMHFILLSFLPLRRMRKSTHPAYGAGCGQLFLVRRDAYDAAGGHAAIRGSLHDGITLPRAFRSAGWRTDLFDATDLAVCRMYRSAAEVWRGLAKNATEGIATPGKLAPVTLLLVAGQVVPPLVLAAAVLSSLTGGEALRDPWVLGPALAGTAAAYLPRLAAVHWFRQPLSSALLHPAGILFFLTVQWYALFRHLAGRPSGWKGRTYAPRPAE